MEIRKKKHLQSSKVLFAKQLGQIFKILKLFLRFHCFANDIFSGFCWIKISAFFQIFPSFFCVSQMIILQIFIGYISGFANDKN